MLDQLDNPSTLRLNDPLLQQLMLRSTEGDSAAYQQLLNQLTHFLKQWFQSKKIDSTLIDDLIQEILIAIHKSRHTYDQKRNFTSWFLAIAHYKYSDFLRHHYKTKNHTEINEDFIATKSLENFYTENSQNHQDITPYLDQLSEQQKKILVYAKIDELSIKQIACLLDLSESNVKVNIHRSIQKLKNLIRGES
jgi:RNA polymerase sigma-70 factor (ECF subfamily)